MQDIDFTTGTSVAILNPSAAKSVVTNAIVKFQCRISATKALFLCLCLMADDTWASSEALR